MRIDVLWDESHLWGLLVWRALDHHGLDYRLVSAAEVAGGALRDGRTGGLVVPGGIARRKAELLGPAGVRAIREYVEAGGFYLGFCGGAGLGLSGGGLDLCAWTRRAFADRLEHFVSGHVHAQLPPAGAAQALRPATLREAPLLPVWWPGRFNPCPSPAQGDGVQVLASYGDPGPDAMVADIALASLPRETLDDWQHLYGVRLWPRGMAGQPCVVATSRGRGTVVLSYAHLETPASAEANQWLAHLLEIMAVRSLSGPRLIPAWDVAALPLQWADPVLVRAAKRLEDIIRLGQEHLLLYWRNSWLLGWRQGLPGATLASLNALVRQLAARTPSPEAQACWAAERQEFDRLMDLFHRACAGYLLAERLAASLRSGHGHGADPEHGGPDEALLREQRLGLFGQSPGVGGLAGSLALILEKLSRVQLSGKNGQKGSETA